MFRSHSAFVRLRVLHFGSAPLLDARALDRSGIPNAQWLVGPLTKFRHHVNLALTLLSQLYVSCGELWFGATPELEQQILEVSVIGEGGVGKSCITLRFTQNQFVPYYDPTIEDMHRQHVHLKEDGTLPVECFTRTALAGCNRS